MQNPSCGHSVLHEKCPECAGLQSKWYEVLASAGFEDAENTAAKGRPLKEWTGFSVVWAPWGNGEVTDALEQIATEPQDALACHFPASHLKDAERFAHGASFDELCGNICRHGNHRLTPKLVREVWVCFLDGATNRRIAEQLGINDTLVWRTIQTLTQWMELMDLDEVQDAPLATVVLRGLRRGADDRSFVFATWRNALWYDDDDREEGQADRFYRNATRDIRLVLGNPDTVVRFACLGDDANFIVGYSVITGDCLQFVYVKVDYRNRGIGTLLVPKGVKQLSPVLTKIGRAIAIKKNLIKENETE